jgi:hypothetical protein
MTYLFSQIMTETDVLMLQSFVHQQRHSGFNSQVTIKSSHKHSDNRTTFLLSEITMATDDLM